MGNPGWLHFIGSLSTTRRHSKQTSISSSAPASLSPQQKSLLQHLTWSRRRTPATYDTSRTFGDETRTQRPGLASTTHGRSGQQGGKVPERSKIDLVQSFDQIRVDPADVPKTAFRTHRGNYLHLTMQMGDKNAVSTQQRLLDTVFDPIAIM